MPVANAIDKAAWAVQQARQALTKLSPSSPTYKNEHAAALATLDQKEAALKAANRAAADERRRRREANPEFPPMRSAGVPITSKDVPRGYELVIWVSEARAEFMKSPEAKIRLERNQVRRPLSCELIYKLPE